MSSNPSGSSWFEDEVLRQLQEGKPVIERALLVASGLKSEEEVEQYERKLASVAADFKAKSKGARKFFDKTPKQLRVMESLFDFVRSAPSDSRGSFRLTDAIDSLSGGGSRQPLNSIGLSSIYAVLGLRAGVDSCIYHDYYSSVLNCFTVKSADTVVDTMASAGFGTQVPQQYQRGTLTTLVAITYNLGGFQKVGSGDIPGAVADFESAVRLEPGYASAQSNLGAVLVNSGRAEEAFQPLQKAIELEPNHPRAFFHLGRAKRATGDLSGAAADFKTAIRLQPDSVPTLKLLSEVSAELNKPEDVVWALEKLTKLDTNDGEAFCSLGQAHLTLGDKERAERALREAVALRPDDTTTLKKLGGLMSDSGNYRGAARVFGQYVGKVGDDAEAYLSLGRAKLALNDIEAAERAFARTVELKPDNVEALKNLAGVNLTLGNYQRAEKAMEGVVQLRPDDVEAHYNLGMAKLGLMDHKGADRVFERACELDPHNAAAFNGTASARLFLGDYEGAREAALKAVAIDRKNPYFRKTLGMANYRLWDYHTAKSDFEAAEKMGLEWKDIDGEKEAANTALCQLELAAKMHNKANPQNKVDWTDNTLGPRVFQQLEEIARQKITPRKYHVLESATDSFPLEPGETKEDYTIEIMPDLEMLGGKIVGIKGHNLVAVKEGSSGPQQFIDQGLAGGALGNWSSAEKCLDMAIRADPENAAAHMIRTYIDSRQGKSGGDHNHFDKAVELDSRYARAQDNGDMGIATALLEDLGQRRKDFLLYLETVKLIPRLLLLHPDSDYSMDFQGKKPHSRRKRHS